MQQLLWRLVYFFVFVPVALCLRLVTRPLDLRSEPDRASYLRMVRASPDGRSSGLRRLR